MRWNNKQKEKKTEVKSDQYLLTELATKQTNWIWFWGRMHPSIIWTIYQQANRIKKISVGNNSILTDELTDEVMFDGNSNRWSNSRELIYIVLQSVPAKKAVKGGKITIASLLDLTWRRFWSTHARGLIAKSYSCAFGVQLPAAQRQPLIFIRFDHGGRLSTTVRLINVPIDVNVPSVLFDCNRILVVQPARVSKIFMSVL